MEKLNQADLVHKLGNRLSSSPLIYGVLLAGVALRLSGLTASALHYDEGFSLGMARQGLFEMIRSLTTSINPPGWEILLWFVARLLGYNTLAARFIPLLASIVTLWVAYHLTQELHLLPSHQVVALAILAFLPYQFWMAQEARTYAIYGLLYTLGILWALQGRWLGLGAVMGLMLWFHNTAVFYVPALVLLALARHARAWKSIIGAALLTVVSWSAWLPVLLPQAGYPIPWFPPFTLSHFATNLQAAFFDGALREGWALFGFLAVILGTAAAIWKTLASLLSWLAWRMKSGNVTSSALPSANSNPGDLTAQSASPDASPAFLLMLAVVVPLVLFLLFTALIQNVFLFRPLSPLVPAWVMWLTPTITFQTFRKGKLMFAQAVLPALWTWVIIAGLVGWSPDRTGNLPNIVSLIRADWQSGDVIYHSSALTAELFQYYLPNDNHFLINENGIAERGIANALKLSIPEVALEDIPYQRAWIVWLRDVNSNERMKGYVENCQIVGSMFFWQSSQITEVYLCRRSK